MNTRHDTPEAAARPADGRVPVVVNDVVTGYAGRIIDFSSADPAPERGHGPGALTAVTVPAGGRLLVGHVAAASRHDPSVPVPAFEYGPGDFEADARCGNCPAASELSFDGDGALMLVIHHDGCPELAAHLALAGAL